MGRLLLLLFGLGSIAWAVVALFMPSIITGLQGVDLESGDAKIEFIAVNVGLIASVGVLAIVGAMLKRMRITALVTMIVLMAGLAGGRILGLIQGIDAGIYTYGAMGIEVATALLGFVAFGVEKANAATQAAPPQKPVQSAEAPTPAA